MEADDIADDFVTGVRSWGSGISAIRKNVAVTSFAYAAGAIGGLVAQAVLARTVGGEAYGVYIAAFSLATLLRMGHSLAPPEYVVSAAADEPARLPALVSTSLRLDAALALVLIGAAAGAAAGLGLGAAGVVVAMLLMVRSSAAAAYSILQAGFRVLERLEVGSIASGVGAIVAAAASIVAVLAGGGIVGAAAAVGAAGVAVFAYSRWRLYRLTGPPASAVRVTASFVRTGLPFAAVGTLMLGQNYADAIIIQIFLGERETGLYGAAYRLFTALGWLPLIYTTSSYRALATLGGKDRDALRDFVERSATGLVAIALPFAVGGAILAEPIMRTVFGQGFAAGSSVLAILSAGAIAAFPAVLLIAANVLAARPSAAAVLLLAGFGGNAAVNVALVPRYGIVAAAWVTLATHVLLAAGATVLLASQGVRLRWPAHSARFLVPAALLAAAVYPLREVALPVPILAGGVAYAGAALALRLPQRLILAAPADDEDASWTA